MIARLKFVMRLIFETENELLFLLIMGPNENETGRGRFYK
jgi:hypothetical protein